MQMYEPLHLAFVCATFVNLWLSILNKNVQTCDLIPGIGLTTYDIECAHRWYYKSTILQQYFVLMIHMMYVLSYTLLYVRLHNEIILRLGWNTNFYKTFFVIFHFAMAA